MAPAAAAARVFNFAGLEVLFVDELFPVRDAARLGPVEIVVRPGSAADRKLIRLLPMLEPDRYDWLEVGPQVFRLVFVWRLDLSGPAPELCGGLVPAPRRATLCAACPYLSENP